jgi:ribosome biogenesis GTPase
MYLATVIARQGKAYIVEDDQHEQHQCHVRSQAQDAVCGDHVLCESQHQSQDVIESIQPRVNQLTRIDNFQRTKTLAANIDHMVIVIAALPTYSNLLIDKYLACAELTDCRASLVVNKAEYLNQQCIDIDQLENMYAPLVENFIITSAHLGYGVSQLKRILRAQTSILVGQSGVGKSSLINRLFGNTDIKVGSLSENIQQGKHTTTNAFAYPLDRDSKIIDSPGVRSFTPVMTDNHHAARGFKEFQEFIGKCKFADCQHLNEPGCAVKCAVESGDITALRYASYQSICAENNSH